MFNNEELLLISECILKEIENMAQAEKLVVGLDAVSGIAKDMQKLKKLNDKVCRLADGD